MCNNSILAFMVLCAHLFPLRFTGSDNIGARLLKLAAPFISDSLMYICNQSILNSTFPDKWKEAKVRPLYNKKRYDSELPYQRPDLIEVMEIEIDLTTSTNVHTGFYISVRGCLD